MGSLWKGRLTKESIIYKLWKSLDVVRHRMLPFTPAISMLPRINFIVCCRFQPWPRVLSVVKLNISTYKVAAKNCSELISYLKFIHHNQLPQLLANKIFVVVVVIWRLSGIKDLVRGKQLVSVILKLMGYCVKLKVIIFICLFPDFVHTTLHPSRGGKIQASLWTFDWNNCNRSMAIFSKRSWNL